MENVRVQETREFRIEPVQYLNEAYRVAWNAQPLLKRARRTPTQWAASHGKIGSYRLPSTALIGSLLTTLQRTRQEDAIHLGSFAHFLRCAIDGEGLLTGTTIRATYEEDKIARLVVQNSGEPQRTYENIGDRGFHLPSQNPTLTQILFSSQPDELESAVRGTFGYIVKFNFPSSSEPLAVVLRRSVNHSDLMIIDASKSDCPHVAYGVQLTPIGGRTP